MQGRKNPSSRGEEIRLLTHSSTGRPTPASSPARASASSRATSDTSSRPARIYLTKLW